MHLATHDIRFTPRLWPTLAALLVIALTLHLARWQQSRATEKTALQGEFDRRTIEPAKLLDGKMRDADNMRYARFRAIGEWQARGQIFVDNKTDGGTAGYHVITPLKLAGSDTLVLVNRGWIARAPGYPAPPKVEVPGGQAEVEGMATVPTTHFLELSPAAVEGNVWQNLTIARFRDASKQDVLPVVLLAAGATPGLVPITERPDARVEKHLEYMLTWYSLAVTTLLLWLGLNLKITKLGGAPANTSQ